MYHIQVKPRKNSKKYSKTIANLKDESAVINYMRENDLHYAGTPYFFSHIRLSDGSIITQTAVVGASELVCSPTKLNDMIK